MMALINDGIRTEVTRKTLDSTHVHADRCSPTRGKVRHVLLRGRCVVRLVDEEINRVAHAAFVHAETRVEIVRSDRLR